MSGQLVGEVLTASDSLRERGLSERGFHALIAIAEKAHPVTRQGSVRWSHIRAALYGASQRTAERAVQDLKSSKLIAVIRPGFNNNHGSAAAPIYEIQPLTDTDTHVAVSVGGDTDTHVAASVRGDTDKTGGRYRQTEDRSRHPGVVLDGSLDGSTDGGGDDEPRCGRHRHIAQPPPCLDCKATREQRDANHEADHRAIRAAIDNCHDCDDYGRLIYESNVDCPKHPNFRRTARPTPPAWPDPPPPLKMFAGGGGA